MGSGHTTTTTTTNTTDDMLSGTNLEDSIRRMNDDRRLWYERIKQAISANKSIPVVSRSAWDWANGVYHSRGFPSHLVSGSGEEVAEEGEDYCGCLIPVMDLTNHVPGEDVEWRSTPEGVELRAGGKGIKSGEPTASRGNLQARKILR